MIIDGLLSLKGGQAGDCDGGGGSGGSLSLITTHIRGHGFIDVAGGDGSGSGTGLFIVSIIIA